jgi:ATP-dependent Clp protease protease subunit
MNVQFKAKGTRGEIWLYDQIGASFWGDGITANEFRKELAALGKVSTINVRINSPGGDVFDGFAIYNQLVQHPAEIEVDVDGVAASIASIIAMAGNTIRMAKNSMMMIHNPQGVAIGDSNEMDRVKALLQQVKGNLTTTYVDRTGNSVADLEAWMDEETWFTAEACVERGFADLVTKESRVAACFDLSRFRNVPQDLKARVAGAVAQPNLDMRRARIQQQQERVSAVLRA